MTQKVASQNKDINELNKSKLELSNSLQSWEENVKKLDAGIVELKKKIAA